MKFTPTFSINALTDRLTPRAKVGLGALCAIGWIIIVLDLSDSVSAQRERVQDLRAELAVQRAAVAQEELLSLRDEARSRLEDLEARIPVSNTIGLASAEIQGLAEAALRRGGLDDARIEVVVAERLPAGLVIFEVQVSGRDPGGSFMSVLSEIASLDRPVMPIALDWFGSNQRIRMVLRMPARIAEA